MYPMAYARQHIYTHINKCNKKEKEPKVWSIIIGSIIFT